MHAEKSIHLFLGKTYPSPPKVWLSEHKALSKWRSATDLNQKSRIFLCQGQFVCSNKVCTLASMFSHRSIFALAVSSIQSRQSPILPAIPGHIRVIVPILPRVLCATKITANRFIAGDGPGWRVKLERIASARSAPLRNGSRTGRSPNVPHEFTAVFAGVFKSPHLLYALVVTSLSL